MDSRRLAACIALGTALTTFSQRRRLAAVLASIGRRLVQGDGLRRVIVRMIDGLMTSSLPDEETLRREVVVGVGELFAAIHRVALEVQRERYFEVCGAGAGAEPEQPPPMEVAVDGAATQPPAPLSMPPPQPAPMQAPVRIVLPSAAPTPQQPQAPQIIVVQPAPPSPQPLLITPTNAFLFVPPSSHVQVDEEVDPFFGMAPSTFGRDDYGALVGAGDPLLSAAGDPPSPRSPCEADLWCWETMDGLESSDDECATPAPPRRPVVGADCD